MFVNSQLFSKADCAIILGTGIKFEVPDMELICEVPYADIESIPSAGIKGHPGKLSLYRNSVGQRVALFQGRIHLYEGHDIVSVQSIIALINKLSIRNVIITNAAGGISDDLQVTDIMVIDKIKNYQIPTGSNNGLLGMMSRAPLEIQTNLKERTLALDVELKKGTYIAVRGPNFETDTEIEMFRAQGGNTVGMSTYLEMLYTVENKMNCIGFSIVTNSWADNSHKVCPPTHEEVLDNAKLANEKINTVFEQIISKCLE